MWIMFPKRPVRSVLEPFLQIAVFLCARRKAEKYKLTEQYVCYFACSDGRTECWTSSWYEGKIGQSFEANIFFTLFLTQP